MSDSVLPYLSNECPEIRLEAVQTFSSLKFEDKEAPEDETVLDNGEIIPFNPFRSIFVDDD